MRVLNFGCTSLNEFKAKELFTIHPNPAQDYVYVTLSAKCDIRIIDIRGAIMKEFREVAGEMQLPVGDLAKGIYFLSASGEKVNTTQKLVLQ